MVLLVGHCMTLLLVGEFIGAEVRLEDGPAEWSHPLHRLISHSSNDIGTSYQPVLITYHFSLLQSSSNDNITVLFYWHHQHKEVAWSTGIYAGTQVTTD